MVEHGRALIPCREAVRQLWDYLDGAVPDTAHHDIDAHLAFCRRCCGELEFVAHLRAILADQAAEGVAGGEDTTDPGVSSAVRRLEQFVEGLS
jgi:predicted anti-sigma-YlaC factor YlaD